MQRAAGATLAREGVRQIMRELATSRTCEGVLLALVVGALVCACDRRRDEEPGKATIRGATLASPMARDAVVKQIAHAHCTREDRCGHIGPALRYGDHAACLGRFVPETR